VLGKHLPQPCPNRRKWRRCTEAVQDDSIVRLKVHEDELTEVTVSGDQNPSFPVGDGEDFVIWQARGVLAANSADIMPACANASISALSSSRNLTPWQSPTLPFR
jgi:hypothetical protein